MLSGCVSQGPESTAPEISVSPSPSVSPLGAPALSPAIDLVTRTKRVLVLVDPVFMEPDKYWIDVQLYFCFIDGKYDGKNICDDLKKKNRLMIDQYIADLKAEGLTVFRMNIASTDPVYKNVEALRKLIQVQREFNEIDGVVLLGKFPYALIEDGMCKTEKTGDDDKVACITKSEPSYYYTDSVLGDADGNWQKVFTAKKKGKYTARYQINNQELSNRELGPDDHDLASPEIWISRIDAERAMGGLEYCCDTDANPEHTMVRVQLKQDQIYRFRVQSQNDTKKVAPGSHEARDFRKIEDELPLIVAIHDADSGEPEKLTPLFGSTVFFKPKKNAYYNLFLNISGNRGTWISEENVEKKPVVLVETPTDPTDFSGAFVHETTLSITSQTNKSFLMSPIQELELYAKYLQRNHLFRTKQWAPKSNMIRLNTDAFFNEKQDGLEALATDGETQAAKVETFNQGVFLGQLFPLGEQNSQGVPSFSKTYKYGSLEAHSNSSGHEFANGFADDSGWFLNMSTLLQLADNFNAANILFFINHGCSDSNIDLSGGYPDTGSVYLFRFGGLVQFGHSFLGPNGYYREISETFAKGGDAGSGFLNAIHRETADIRTQAAEKGDADYLGRKRAYYKVLLGDGTLKSDY